MTKDNFSAQAELYAKYRPHYPNELYEFIFEHVHVFDKAWDCATGNGQVASVLSHRFDKVFGTDISQQQLSEAATQPNIEYRIGSAESSGLEEKVDLITVAQAIHWFKIEGFYQEVKRLAKPHTVLAYWGYELMTINETVDPLILHFYNNTLDGFWDPERKFLENAYKDINVPLHDVKRKLFTYQVDWSIDQLTGYLSSWSSVQKYIKKHHINPVDSLRKEIKPLWKDKLTISFPIFLTIGCIRK